MENVNVYYFAISAVFLFCGILGPINRTVTPFCIFLLAAGAALLLGGVIHAIVKANAKKQKNKQQR